MAPVGMFPVSPNLNPLNCIVKRVRVFVNKYRQIKYKSGIGIINDRKTVSVSDD